MDEDGPTAPSTPLSFVSSPSIGYYSHPSRPSSRTGLWVDQATSSLNLIMPSSAMFVKTREPTVEGDKMGFLKMMVAGRSRTWNLRLIRELFKWEGIIANDFDDEFLKSPVMEEGGSSDTGSNMDAHGLSSGVESRSSQSSDPSIEWTRRRRHKQQQQHAAADALVERYASTTVLPMWARAGLDEQDMHQEILVKNICFVDTPGYNSFTNTQRAMDLVISYLGVQFQATNEFFSRSIVSDDSLGRFLANNTTGAHSHVDLCLYVIEDQLTALDIQFLARLQPFVNILPVLIPNLSSSHDAQSPDVTAVRQDIIRQLREHEIYAYGMGQSKEQQDSLFSTRLAMEDELSPPPLVLDAQVPSPYVFTTPPFVLKLSGNDVEERRTDAAVQHLDIHRSDNAQLRHPTEGSTQSSTSIDTRGQLDALRHWIYTENLPALRHQTTLKFLSWRRRLPFMASLSIDSSQESGSLQPRHQNPQLMYPDLGDYASGSFQAFSTSINKSSPPPSVADQPHPLQQHPHQHQRAMPTHGLAQLHTQDRQRLSAKAAQMLEPYSQVFERILRERHEAWQLALQGLEREQRIEFLVQEIRRWATEGALPHTDQQQPLAPGHQELDDSYRHVVGLGLGSGHVSVRPPSLKDALDPDLASTRANTHLSTQRRTGKRRTKKSPIPKATENSDLPEETKSEYDHGEDPLGLGQLMGRLLGALGRGLVQVVMMIGMGSFATWIYTHFLEHRAQAPARPTRTPPGQETLPAQVPHLGYPELRPDHKSLEYPDRAFLTRARPDLQARQVEVPGVPLLGNLVGMIRNRNQQLQYLQQRFLVHGDFMYG
ncbi:hypothetical protein CPC16_004608 [Podila verticillata]|nr:hypothetical protein CPC16_004608 [Podila verticillata]